MIVGLLGTDFSSSNRGCGALGYAAVEILNSVCEERGESLEVFAFLYRINPMPQITTEGVKVHYIKICPKKISFWKEIIKIFNRCDFVWDFTGGDSFSDIYGVKRFCANSMIKEVAIWSKTKFFMAPQTIGPFSKRFPLLWAKHIVKKSEICFVRDSISEEYVKKTFGVTPVVTTDVAFSLPYEKTEPERTNKIRIGFNPSGLLWEGTKEFCASKHITVDYREYVDAILGNLCNDERFEVFLIPHVFSKNMESKENDLKACVEIKDRFPSVKIVCDFETPMEAKRAISAMDIFIGARMHATIAAFSTGVITIPFSYSRKFEGLYQDLGYTHMISATCMKTREAIDKTMEWVNNCEQLEKHLEEAMVVVAEKKQVLVDALNRFMNRKM